MEFDGTAEVIILVFTNEIGSWSYHSCAYIWNLVGLVELSFLYLLMIAEIIILTHHEASHWQNTAFHRVRAKESKLVAACTLGFPAIWR